MAGRARAPIRGYRTWQPKAQSAVWLAATLEVLEEYREEWPLTVRQVFYRLIETHDYEKSEPAYESLVRIISRARRSHAAGGIGIPFEAIRDGGLSHSIDPHFYDDDDHFEGVVARAAASFRLDRQAGQSTMIEFWCEAGGMLPILEQAANEYGIKVTASGGYDSLPLRHDLAVRAAGRANRDLKTLVLHVGDFDPSGENMREVLSEDAEEMAYQLIGDSGWLRVERLALTADQVLEYQVQTAPPKPLDSRMRGFVDKHWELHDHFGSWHITAQLEALTPTQLRSLFAEAVESRFDRATYERVLEDEKPIREDLLRRLELAGFETKE